MYSVFGLPVHPLVVHGTVVSVPVAAVLVITAGLWPRVRYRLVWPAFAASVLATGLVAAAALTGGPLARRVPPSALIAHHAQLAKLLAVWVVAMTGASFALAYAAWGRAGGGVPGWLRVPRQAVLPDWAARAVATRLVLPVLIGLSLLTGAGTLVQVVLVGHSGAQATWSTGSPVRPSSASGHR
ncbi:MAG TPA: hypothetical protein VJT31_22445 [Rugosimonospora sp.]|nr:hypothetical protein [Rugosimonospora sp.]